MTHTNIGWGVFWVCALQWPLAALAQQTGGGIEEIMVTARRETEVLQDAPASISVLTEDALDAANVKNMADVVNLTPGVTIVTSTAEVGDTQINIRGINGARDAENNIALVVDGILKTNTAQLNQIQGTLSQIEVLKGPQGAYYGRNAAAGAVVMTTRKPGDELTLDLTGSYAGEFDTSRAEATFSGPINDALGFVLFGDYRETDGFYENTGPNPQSAGNTVDAFRGWNVGGRLVFAASDEFEIDFKLRFGEVDASALNFGAVFNLPTFALGNPDFNEDINDYTVDYIGNIVPENEQDTLEYSAKLTYDLGFATLTGWYLHSDVDQDWLADSTSASLYRFELQPSCTQTRTDLANAGYVLPSPQILMAAPFTSVFGPFGPTTCDGTQFQLRNQRDDSVELRLASNAEGPLGWSAGVYYLNIDRQNGVAIAEDTGQGGIRNLYNPPGSTNPTSLLFNDEFGTDVYAVFGSVDYDLTDQWTFSAALRYDREERDVSSLVPNAIDPATGAPINPGLPATGTIPDKSETYDELQPKLSVTYKPTDDWTMFANWGIGFKAGGFNNQGSKALIDSNFNVPLGSGLLINDDYREETSSAWELGTKAALFDRRLSLDVVLYRTDVDDMQFFEFFTGTFGLLRVVSNIDDVKIEGVELNATWQVTDSWTVFAGGNIIDSEIEENASRPNTVGNESPYTADYTLNAGTQLKWPIAESLDVVVRADWRLTGPTWFHTVQAQDIRTIFDLFFPGAGTANYTRTQRDSYNLVDLRAGVESEHWSVIGFVNNAFDEDWVAEVIPAPEFGGSFVSPGTQREVGIEIGYRF
jgi:iron complex outermembrane receptor protein